MKNHVGQFDKDDRFDYESELKDDVDKLTFGKYKGQTPFQVFVKDPGYLVWCWNNTIYWAGSEELVRKASMDSEMSMKERPMIMQAAQTNKSSWPSVAEFEEAMLEAFGEFPTPYWKTVGRRMK